MLMRRPRVPCHASQCVCVCACVFKGSWVVALLSAVVGWAHLSLKTGDLWSQLPASRIASLTELWKSLSIAHWPNWITSSALFRARFLNGWFKAHTCTHTCTHHRHGWLFIPSICRAGRYCLPFHSTPVLIDFWLSSPQCLCECLSLYLNMPPRLLFSSHCFCSLWWIICFAGRLFCVISPYSTSHLLSFHYRHLFDTVCLPRHSR